MAIEAAEIDNDGLASEIGNRLRLYRESLATTQEKFAGMIGGTKRAIQNNEAGTTAPNSRLLRRLSELGLNVNWLLTGNGPMLLAELARSENWDPELLVFVIETVSDNLRNMGRELPPNKFAQIVVLFYEDCHKSQSRNPVMVERLLKIA
jgi:transcriptional regulator with XRE-family HTH domain